MEVFIPVYEKRTFQASVAIHQLKASERFIKFDRDPPGSGIVKGVYSIFGRTGYYIVFRIRLGRTRVPLIVISV